MKPNLTKNANCFVIFSVFFTARAYYPVLAILFLDLGLSLDQFVFLNLIWAATIFLFEVPSGALADSIGRRTLLIAASWLMLVEMLCLLLAPRDGGVILLALCIVNRICSGLSEACASGADEALAYDSLMEEGRVAAWDKLLARVMRWRALGFVVAMVIGGLLYDSRVINNFLPGDWQLTEDVVHRLPVALVLCQALVCLFFTFRMVEPNRPSPGSPRHEVIRLILSTARWAFSNSRILLVVLIGVAIDSIVRNFATINSSYFRLIDLPEWSYGFIGAGIGILSWFVPAIAKKLNTQFSLLSNLALIAVCTLVGLIALIPAWPVWGVLPTAFLMTMMGFLAFTVSRVLHQEVDSSRRATVLSLKGMIFNLGYGLFSLGFSALLASFPVNPADLALRSALVWQVVFFIGSMLGLFVWASLYLRRKHLANNAVDQ